MHVVAAVPPDLAQRLRKLAASRFSFECAGSWDEAVQLILRRPVEIGVVDPALTGRPSAHEIERLRVLFPSLPLVLYTHLTAEVAPMLLRLGQTGIRQVLLARHDDHPRRVSEVLGSEESHAVSAQLLLGIGDLLSDWPGELRWAIETMIRDPGAVQSVQQLADRARMDRRTCLRWFARAGLPPPSAMLAVLRAVYAHRLLMDPGYTVEDVAARLGYSQVRSFVSNVKDVFGMTPSEMRISLAPEAALDLVRRRYFAGGDGRLAEVS